MRGTPSSITIQIFQNYFLEVSHRLSDRLKGAIYFVNSKDEFNSITEKVTFGASWDLNLDHKTSTAFDVALQNAKRDFEFYKDSNDDSRSLETSNYNNLYISFSFGKSGLYSAGLLTERSTDILDTDRRSTIGNVETAARWWSSIYVLFDLGMKHQIRLFAGKRRGGPACTAGTCYELLPFEGIELNITSRL